MKRLVHTTRGYPAGFGTSGSLLAGAALLFLLASAIVAFRGWPQVGAGPAISVLSAPQASAPSHVGKRLAAFLSRRAAVGAGGGAQATTPWRRATRVGAPRGSGVAGPTVAAPVAAATPTRTGSPAPSSASTCGSTGCNVSGGAQSVITHTANSVTQEVSNIGTAVGSQVQSTTQSAANAASSVSPQAGSAVQSAGQTVAGTVTGTATGAANTTSTTISQVSSALGGGH